MLEINKGDFVRITGKNLFHGTEKALLPVGTICRVESVLCDGDLELLPQYHDNRSFGSSTYVYPVTSVEKGAMLWHPAVETDDTDMDMDTEDDRSYYAVTIVEMLCKKIKVKASSKEEATSKAEAARSSSKIVLTAEDFDHVEFYSLRLRDGEGGFLEDLEREVYADEC